MTRFALLALLCLLATNTHAGTPAPHPIPLSPAGPDQLQTVVPIPGGGYYAAGFAAAAVGGPRAVVLVKLDADGLLVPSFDGDGIATTAVMFVGGNDEIDLVLQDGLPVVSATVANSTLPQDRDIAILRFESDGDLDPSFGDEGMRILNLNDAVLNASDALVGLDSPRDLAVGDDGSLYLFAVTRALDTAMGAPRTDTDSAVAKLTPDGDLDLGYAGGTGVFRHDIDQTNANARSLLALPGGALLAGGYANTPDAIDTTQPVVLRLTPGGALDDTFAFGGQFHEVVMSTQTEVYAMVEHGADVVLAGYGRDSGDTNDYVVWRATKDDFTRDLDWGGAFEGVVVVDPSGQQLGSNARAALALPDGRTLVAGSTGPSNQPQQDAAFIVLTAQGTLDTALDPDGQASFKFGTDGNDSFWGVAHNDGDVLLVGFKGGGMSQNETTNDDAYALLLPDAVPDAIFASGFEG